MFLWRNYLLIIIKYPPNPFLWTLAIFFSAGQRLILTIWQEKAASPLHILHGGFPIGSFIIPLIANPFLAIPKRHHHMDNRSYENSSFSMMQMTDSLTPKQTAVMMNNTEFGNGTNIPQNGTSGRIEYLRESRIEYPYLIAAVITVALSVVFFIYHFRERRKMASDVHEKSLKTKRQPKMSFKRMFNPATCADGRLCYGLQIFTGLVIYFFNLLGAERIGGKFIRAFSIEQLDFSVSDGSYLNMAFWISHAVGRVTGFLVARWIPIRVLILIETGGLLLTIIFMNIFAYRNTLALWILTQPFGFFLGPIFPSGIGWGDYHIQLTGMGITIILLGASCGGVAYLKLTGFLFENYGPRAYLYQLLGIGIAAFSLAIILDLIGSQHGHRFAKKAEKDQDDEIRVDKILLQDGVN